MLTVCWIGVAICSALMVKNMSMDRKLRRIQNEVAKRWIKITKKEQEYLLHRNILGRHRK
jgi:hypothetical protein